MRALAYHITWGTYGTRLHGDPRGTVDRDHNEFGTPVLGPDSDRWEMEMENLKFPPVRLSYEQRIFIESTIPKICERGHWIHHTCAGGPDHVHIVLTSDNNPETIRRLLKRWLGQELSVKWPFEHEDQTWWAECGSIRWIGDSSYFKRAFDYVHRQRATR